MVNVVRSHHHHSFHFSHPTSTIVSSFYQITTLYQSHSFKPHYCLFQDAVFYHCRSGFRGYRHRPQRLFTPSRGRLEHASKALHRLHQHGARCYCPEGCSSCGWISVNGEDGKWYVDDLNLCRSIQSSLLTWSYRCLFLARLFLIERALFAIEDSESVMFGVGLWWGFLGDTTVEYWYLVFVVLPVFFVDHSQLGWADRTGLFSCSIVVYL